MIKVFLTFMLNKTFSFEEHLTFINKLKISNDKKYFLLFKENQAFGVIYFNNIKNQTCEFGLYAKPSLKGMGQILIDEIKNYAFEVLKIKYLKAYVFKNNEKALKLYKNNNFITEKEDERFFYIILNNPHYKTLPS